VKCGPFFPTVSTFDPCAAAIHGIRVRLVISLGKPCKSTT